MEKTMKNFYVIWRRDEDQFFVTVLQLTDDEYAEIDNDELVARCWDAEWGEIATGANPFRCVSGATYDLVEVFTGDNIEFV